MNSYGNVKEHPLTITSLASTSRRRCKCGCGTRATHLGRANGLGMYSGCHQSVIIWRSTKGDKIRFTDINR